MNRGEMRQGEMRWMRYVRVGRWEIEKRGVEWEVGLGMRIGKGRRREGEGGEKGGDR